MFNRTWLFVPATERFLSDKLAGLADVLIFDLEDSIREEEKPSARIRLCKALNNDFGAEIYIRINAGAVGEEDLLSLNSCRFDGLIIPKVEKVASIIKLSEQIKDKKLIALIESVEGVFNLEQIAKLPCIYGLAFGGEDYCRELGVETNELAMQFARGKLVLLSKYYEKYCLDTICMNYIDESFFLQQYRESIAMGFNSKLLIHPAQAKMIRALEETEMKVEEMRIIVHTFEKSDSGLVKINEHWYEKPHIERLKK